MSTIDDMTVSVALGDRADQHEGWRTVSGPLGKLFDVYFTGFPVGAKEGACLLQGALISDVRGSKEVTRNYLMMFDSDSGASLDDLVTAVSAQGLYACIWTTHSHLKSTTTVAEDELLRWSRKAKINIPSDAVALSAFMADYLASVKGYDAAITSSITAVTKHMLRGGMKYIVEHAPMTKARVLLVLDKPYEFVTDAQTQSAAIDEWKAKYRAVGAALGLTYDPKCQDPARLFYLPRRPVGSRESDYEFRWVDGTTLDLDAFDTRAPKSTAAPTGVEVFEQQARKGHTFITPGLAQFLRKHNKWFKAADWLAAIAPDDVRSERGEKLTCRCPADEMHSNAGDEDDQGFFAVNGDGDKAFGMYCSHATCSTEAADNGKNWWYLDKACQHYNVSNASELIEFVDEMSFADDAEDGDDVHNGTQLYTTQLRTTIMGLNRSSSVADKQTAIDALSKLLPGAETIELLALYRTNTGTTKTDLEAAMRAARAAAQTTDDNTIGGLPGVPDNPENTTTVWQHWDFEDQLRCVKARLLKVSKARPRLFRDVTGKFVRAFEDNDQLVLDDMSHGGSLKWSHELLKLPLTFKRMGVDGEQSVRPFDAICADLSCATPDDLTLPRLTRVVDVPVFGEKGGLRTTKGYDKDSGIYLLPSRDYLAVPEIVTDEDLDLALYWLGEPLRDIPFSDAYGGAEELPIRLEGEVDEDGHPLPNLARGRSSRVNLLALLIQHFARELIDGPCPLYFVDKPTPGTGASLLMNIVSVIQCGRPAPMLPWKVDEAENTKTITTIMRTNPAMIFWDNVNVKIDSGVLAGAITSGLWQDRLLGESTLVSLPITQELVVAGNNVGFSSELFRRICPIRLDARVARPALDRPQNFYKYADVLSFVEEHRSEIVWAIHVLIRNWQNQGCPHGNYVLQSFTNWSRVMSGIFDAAGISGFMETTKRFYEAENTDNNIDGEVAVVLYSQMQEGEFTAKEMFGMLVETSAFGGGGNGPPALKVELELRGNTEAAMVKSFGHFLGKFVNGTHEVLPGVSKVLQKRMLDGRSRYRWHKP